MFEIITLAIKMGLFGGLSQLEAQVLFSFVSQLVMDHLLPLWRSIDPYHICGCSCHGSRSSTPRCHHEEGTGVKSTKGNVTKNLKILMVKRSRQETQKRGHPKMARMVRMRKIREERRTRVSMKRETKIEAIEVIGVIEVIEEIEEIEEIEVIELIEVIEVRKKKKIGKTKKRTTETRKSEETKKDEIRHPRQKRAQNPQKRRRSQKVEKLRREKAEASHKAELREVGMALGLVGDTVAVLAVEVRAEVVAGATAAAEVEVGVATPARLLPAEAETAAAVEVERKVSNTGRRVAAHPDGAVHPQEVAGGDAKSAIMRSLLYHLQGFSHLGVHHRQYNCSHTLPC